MSEKEEIKYYQDELLYHIKAFDLVCRKCGIDYSLHGGSMLGAIRHKGFIPWDDDIDITMTKDNFLKFKSLIETEMPDYWITDTTSPSPRLLMKRYGERPVVWIDILEYHYISSNKLAQKLKIYLLIFLASMSRTKDTIKNSTVKKHGLLRILVLHIIYYMGKFFPLKVKLNWHRAVARKWFLGDKQLIHRSNDQSKSVHYILPKEYMEEFIDVPFEDTYLKVSKYYKEILTIDFGPNFMTPPSEKDKYSHDDIVHAVCEEIQRKYEKEHCTP